MDERFTAGEIRRMHRLWLGEIYEWAGEYRGVNIAKGAFLFAAAIQIPNITAVHAGLSRDYDPMAKIFREVIARTLKSAAKASSV